MVTLESAGKVIAALGGDHYVAKKYERSVQCIRNWRYGRGIPLALRPIIDADLAPLGKKSTLKAYSRPLRIPARRK